MVTQAAATENHGNGFLTQTKKIVDTESSFRHRKTKSLGLKASALDSLSGTPCAYEKHHLS